MSKNKFLSYKKFIKKGNNFNKEILIAKTKDSHLVGPLLDYDFDKDSFKKRLLSNSIYPLKYYKKASSKKANKLIEKYMHKLESNEVLEVYNNGKIEKHRIIKVPGDFYEKE